MDDTEAALALYEMARLFLPKDAHLYLDGRVAEGWVIRNAVDRTADMEQAVAWLHELGVPVPTREQSAAWIREQLRLRGIVLGPR